MTRFATLFAAAAIIAAPATAASYSAKPVAAASTNRIIGRDIVWTCGPDACQGSTEDGRPAVLCEGLAKRAGRLASFIADGRAFAPAELEKCNASAKPAAASAALARAD